MGAGRVCSWRQRVLSNSGSKANPDESRKRGERPLRSGGKGSDNPSINYHGEERSDVAIHLEDLRGLLQSAGLLRDDGGLSFPRLISQVGGRDAAVHTLFLKWRRLHDARDQDAHPSVVAIQRGDDLVDGVNIMMLQPAAEGI